MTSVDLLASIGGSMGLFLGLSLIRVIQMVDLIVERLGLNRDMEINNYIYRKALYLSSFNLDEIKVS